MTTIAQHAAAARKFAANNNEGSAGYNPHWVAHDAAVAVAADARMDDLVARASEIRAAWNAAVAKHTTSNGVPAAALKLIEKEVGVSMIELQALRARLTKQGA